MTTYLIITCCIQNKFGKKKDGHRMKTYIRSIEKTIDICKGYDIKIFIVENSGLKESYLDQFKTHATIIYTNNNIHDFNSKGVNELLDIKHVISSQNIQPDDMIIKLTGRYHILNDTFIKFVMQNKYDAYVKFFNVCTLKFMDYDCVLGLIAIRCKYYYNFEFSEKYSNEVEMAMYIKNKVTNFTSLDKLDLYCCFADNLRTLIV